MNSALALGELTGPLLVFGGPYSNLQATQAIKAKAETLGIPPENCICTGDIVAYCAQPKETTSLIREWGVTCLMGNCEESFANDADDCGCGFEKGTSCDLLSAQWFTFANSQLITEERRWFGSLPREIRFEYYGKQYLVVHGSVSSINQFIFASNNDDIFQKECELANQAQKTDVIIGGHCGIPFTKKIGDYIWHNAGAIGMPANDGKHHTWFSIITPENTPNASVTITTQVLDYDQQTATQEMIHAGMDNDYAKALTTGIWPSNDVLPIIEKQQQGIPRKTETFTF